MDGQSLSEFLADHPTCCFCGGGTPATERDHVPARVIFDRRHWPEGFIFPACRDCNAATALIEQQMGFLARVYPDIDTPDKEAEFTEILQAIQNNSPEFLQEIDRRPRRTLVKKRLKELGVYGTAEGERVAQQFISVDGPLANHAVEEFCRKLFLALHYRHSGQIVPPSGGLWIDWQTNASFDPDRYELAIANTLPSGTLKRGNRDISPQFFYRFATHPNGDFGLYIVRFRAALALVGYVKMDASRFRDPPSGRLLRPFEHHKKAGGADPS